MKEYLSAMVTVNNIVIEQTRQIGSFNGCSKEHSYSANKTNWCIAMVAVKNIVIEQTRQIGALQW